MKASKKIVLGLCFLICLVLFNLSYFSNSGLFIFGLKGATKINHRNFKEHAEEYTGSRALSSFRIEKFLSKERAQEIAKKVRELEPHWANRNKAMSTLGTASYLDGGLVKQYYKMSEKSNPLMREHFGDLLDDVLEYFRERSPETKVEWREGAALPGFHIFHCNKLFSMPVASVHKDMQFNRLKYEKDEDIDKEFTMSFTLSIELPPGGGGLYTFDGMEVGLLHYLIPRAFMHSIATKTKIDYKVGYMVVHNGQTYHMIAPCAPSDTKYRLTLQGHGVYEKNSNTWWIYW